jgi:uncharacterized protein YndB with AHSA1/START domain
MSRLTLVTGEQDITMKRHFGAPRELVFEAYSSSDHIKQWWGPRTWPTHYCRMDFRPGGTWHYCMKGPEGQEAWGIADYKEIEEPRRILYVDNFSDRDGSRIPPEGEVTVLFEDDGNGGTNMTWHTVYATAEQRDKVIEMGVEAGAGETLERLEEYLATMR